jgi:hypothetical protein
MGGKRNFGKYGSGWRDRATIHPGNAGFRILADHRPHIRKGGEVLIERCQLGRGDLDQNSALDPELDQLDSAVAGALRMEAPLFGDGQNTGLIIGRFNKNVGAAFARLLAVAVRDCPAGT